MRKENRILKNNDFSQIIKNGKKIHTETLTFYFSKNINSNFRIGISISKKISKLAVIRNKLKRQINAVFNQEYDTNKKYDIVVIAKSKILESSYSDISKDIISFLKQL